MALTMTARLLSAARHAYTIKTDGAVSTDGYEDVGYTDVVGFARGVEDIDAGLVGVAPDAIIVAFRGTLPFRTPPTADIIDDWANDCDAVLVADPLGLKGKVHQGFLGAIDAFWDPLVTEVARLADANPGKPIYVTGHSKGGPMANIAAGRLYKLRPHAAIYVCTFAGARAGDEDFATAYTAAITNSDRYEFADDIVPHLPPMDVMLSVARHLPDIDGLPKISARISNMALGYVSVGELHFIKWDGTIVSDSWALAAERGIKLTTLLIELGFQTIVADHSIDPPHDPPTPDPPVPGYYSVLYR
jgi:hypothetical protein